MSHRRVESFLLRLVTQECEQAAPAVWRGRVQHVSSGYELQFDCMQELLTFIHAHCGNVPSILTGQDESERVA